MHSWRVLILPLIEQSALYAKYDFNEPWDGPNNIKLVDQMPPSYACPCKSQKGLTPYKLVVDKDTPFEAGMKLSYADLPDGSFNTFAIVEDLGDPVPWTKPEDLTIEQTVAVLTSHGVGFETHSRHEQFSSNLAVASISFLDGSTFIVGPDVEPDVIRDLCTRNDQRAVDRDALINSSITVVRWDRYITLIVYIILLMVPGLIALRVGRSKMVSKIRSSLMGI